MKRITLVLFSLIMALAMCMLSACTIDRYHHTTAADCTTACSTECSTETEEPTEISTDEPEPESSLEGETDVQPTEEPVSEAESEPESSSGSEQTAPAESSPSQEEEFAGDYQMPISP